MSSAIIVILAKCPQTKHKQTTTKKTKTKNRRQPWTTTTPPKTTNHNWFWHLVGIKRGQLLGIKDVLDTQHHNFQGNNLQQFANQLQKAPLWQHPQNWHSPGSWCSPISGPGISPASIHLTRLTPQTLTGVQTALPSFQIPRNSTAVSRTRPQVPISIQTHPKGPLLLQSPRAPFHYTTEFHRTHTDHQFFSIKDRLKDQLALCQRKNYPAREDATITPFVVFHWNTKITLKEMSAALPSPCSLPTEKCINVNTSVLEKDLEQDKAEETTGKADELHSICRAGLSSSPLCLHFFQVKNQEPD